MPTARQEIYPTVHDGRIYIAGGFAGNGSTSNVLEIFDPTTNSWSTGPDLPEPRHHIGLVTLDGTIYGIGGFMPDATTIWGVRGEVFRLDISGGSWLPGTSMLTPRGEHVAAAHGEKIFVMGGRNDQLVDTNLNEEYDPATDRWTQRASMPTARNSAAGAVIDSLIYIVGGRITTSGSITNMTANEAYSPTTDTWHRRADMPSARGGLAAAAWNGKLYLFGGELFAGGGTVFATPLEYDPATDRWRELPPMKTPRHGTEAVVVGDTVFVIGGANRAGFGAVNTNEGLVLTR
jgi:N-acetylneuraminic acid mutarotase